MLILLKKNIIVSVPNSLLHYIYCLLTEKSQKGSTFLFFLYQSLNFIWIYMSREMLG